MKRKYILSILTVAMLLPFTVVKAQFDAGDSTVCYNIMTNNFATANMLNWNDPDPANWLGVEWNSATPKRIVELSLKQNGVPRNRLRGDNWVVNQMNYYDRHLSWDSANVDTDLKGFLDFSGLSEIKRIKCGKHDSITGFDFQGLNNLEYLYIGHNDMIDSLDFSNLPSLYSVHCGNSDSLVYVDASSCPSLYKLKVAYANELEDINLVGSDNIAFLNLNDCNLTSLDVSTKTELLILNVHDNDNLTSLVGLQNLNKLFALKMADTKITGIIDVAWFNTDSLYKMGVGRSQIDTVANWSMFRADVEAVNVEENRLSLSNATQIWNELAPTNQYDGNDQTRYGKDTLYVGGTPTGYPGEDLIDINGVNVASTFNLFDATGTQVGVTSATGVFTFPTVANVGAYYVEMNNPGAAPANNSVDLVTDTFWVLECPAELDTATSVLLTTITVAQSGATYQWLDCDNANAAIAGATSQSFTATVNGNYAVEMTLGGVCVDTSACVNIATVGVNELGAGNTVSVYPNPMSEVVTIDLENAVKNTQVTVVNVEGKVVYSEIVNRAKVSIDGADWNNGIYIVKITNVEYTKTLKLIK